MISSFVRGVNWAAAQRRGLGEMFLLTKSAWEPLTAAQLCAILRLVAFGMCRGWQHALLRQWLHGVFGEAGAAWSDTADAPSERDAYTIDPEMSAAFDRLSAEDLAWARASAAMASSDGSNWVVVGGERSESGAPMLCGDPHLKVSIPGFWYRVTYRGAVNAAGLAMACMPGINIGHNGKMAWSVTLAYADVEDLYVERFNAEGKYEHKGEWHTPQRLEETLRVKGAEARTITVERTVHGPVLDGTLGKLRPAAEAACSRQDADGFHYKLSYAGLPVRPRTKALVGVRALMDAADFASFDRALSFASDVISLNFTFASASGHFGYVLCGEVPIGRGKPGANGKCGDEGLPLCGWTGEHDYSGWLPHAQLPKALNPPAGVIISANHKLVDYDSYPHYLGNAFKSGYRAQRLHQMVATHEGPVTLALLKQMHMDARSLAAQDFAAVVTRADISKSRLDEPRRRLAATALASLHGWDGTLAADSTIAATYQLMHAALIKLLVAAGIAKTPPTPHTEKLLAREPISGVPLAHSLVFGDGFNGVFKPLNEVEGHLHYNVLQMLHAALEGRTAGKGWWVAQAGGFDAAVCTAAAAAEEQLSTLPDRTWGAMHLTQLVHPLTKSLGFKEGTFLDMPPMRTAGDQNTPMQTATRSLDDMSAGATHVSARIVVDCSDIAKRSWIITPLGASETPGSPHHSDETSLWHSGQYLRVLWDMEEIRAAAKYTTSWYSADAK